MGILLQKYLATRSYNKDQRVTLKQENGILGLKIRGGGWDKSYIKLVLVDTHELLDNIKLMTIALLTILQF